jgi:hypothetical protein
MDMPQAKTSVKKKKLDPKVFCAAPEMQHNGLQEGFVAKATTA